MGEIIFLVSERTENWTSEKEPKMSAKYRENHRNTPVFQGREPVSGPAPRSRPGAAFDIAQEER